ncbi:MAG: MOSC domain-containing protein [Bacteroidetes bacterium]|nr:MOSC domain-containing protein [Bacteroidota bacterium]
MLKVSGLYIYPVKSMRGISLDKARVTDRGFEHDRRWMLVDENNLFISQREIPELALIQIEIISEGLKTTFIPTGASIIIPFQPQTDEFAEVTIWDDTCMGQFVSREADEWFSRMLGAACRLVYMPDDSRRITDQRYAAEDSIVSFADGYPFLLIGQASLDDLNQRLVQPVPMNRFRPSIVFTGGDPYAEDLMHSIVIGDLLFHGVKLCARCNIPGIDQDTAIAYKEPIKTLARYRFKNNKIMYGQNLTHEGLGYISLGDELKVLQLNQDERFFV